MCRLWYVLSGCRELTALSLLGNHLVFHVLPPDTWDLVPHGLTSVRIQAEHTSLGFLFLLENLRELDLAGKSFAALLNGRDEKGHEVDNFLMQISVVLPWHLCAFKFALSTKRGSPTKFVSQKSFYWLCTVRGQSVCC